MHLKLKGDIDITMAIFVIIIGLFSMVVVLRVVDPASHVNVKALTYSEKIASTINTHYLDNGSSEIGFGGKYDVEVEYRDEGYFVIVKGENGKPGESKILLYPNERDIKLVKKYTGLDKVCVIKNSEFPEVVEC